MDDKELYRQILGVVAPWKIEKIDLAMEQDRIDIYLEWPYLQDGTCPECGKKCKVHSNSRSPLKLFKTARFGFCLS
ncbi:MAG: hypothetical protein U9R17_16515 [Thermodesulfobacteriota bacterium]|nr:hypothetical protein [Thermodesulfobacteriota bacterium]